LILFGNFGHSVDVTLFTQDPVEHVIETLTFTLGVPVLTVELRQQRKVEFSPRLVVLDVTLSALDDYGEK
jgi:hypothetical protein